MNRLTQLSLMLLIAVASIITSCNKADTSRIRESADADENKKSLMMNKTNYSEYSVADMQQYSPEMQREIFRAMTPEKRASIWQDRINLAISEETNGSVIQKLQELKAFITTEEYTGEGLDDRERPQIASWVESNMTLIGYDRMHQIAMTFNPKNVQTAAPIVPNNPRPSCECNLKRDWCSVGDDFVNTYCKAADCEGAGWGCGLFWLQSCGGMCQK